MRLLQKLMGFRFHVLFISVGVMLALVGMAFGIWSASLWFGTSTTEGTVVALKSRSSSINARHISVVKSPVVRYHIEGQKYFLESSTGSRPPSYQVGQKVILLYRSANPSTAYIDDFTHRWLPSLFFLGMGTLFIAMGIVIWRSFYMAN